MESKLDFQADADIVERMQRIRSASEVHVALMHREAARVVDWREHVRAKPLVAVTVATLVGFTLVKSAMNTKQPRGETRRGDRPDSAPAAVRSGVLSFVGAMAANMAKNYVSGYIRSQFNGSQHDQPNRHDREQRA